jgi:hypothetical protein
MSTEISRANYHTGCELIDDNNKVLLYLRKGAQNIIYFDVAKALAQFVFTTPTADISLISNKLLLSEMELKQRGIPVDLLLNANESETGKINCFYGFSKQDQIASKS